MEINKNITIKNRTGYLFYNVCKIYVKKCKKKNSYYSHRFINNFPRDAEGMD